MKKLLPYLAFVALTATSNRAHAAVDYVLSGSGVFSCNDTSHSEPGFPVNSFTLGGTDILSSSEPGKTVGTIDLDNLIITRSFDGCSEALIRAFLSQVHTSTLTLKGYRAAGGDKDTRPTVILTITLGNATVTKYQISGNSDGGAPQEKVSFCFSRVTIQTTVQKSDGSLGSSVTVTYDVSTKALS